MNKKKLPEGPSFASFMFESVSDKLNYYFELMEDYGDIVKLPSLGKRYLVNNAEYLKYILKDNVENYPKGGIILKALEHCLGHGLLLSKGETWKHRRKLLAPYFKPSYISQFTPLVHEFTLNEFANWENNELLHRKSFDISKNMMSIVFRIALKIFFGASIDDKKLKKVLKKVYLDNFYSSSLESVIPWFPSINQLRSWLVQNYIKNYIQQIIDDAKANPKENLLIDAILTAKNIDGSPISEQDIFDESKTFLMTGHETSGTAISWALKLLAEHPEKQILLKEELNRVLKDRFPTYEDLENLPYIRGVFEESIRLYPPIWITGRISQKDDYLGDYFIAKGSAVYVCPYTLHRNTQYWDNPEAFMPERHFPDYPNKPPTFASLPFGGGPRVCIASHFAMMECMIIIAMIMQKYSIRLDESHVIEPQLTISLRPKNGIYVFLEKDL